jgi:hypothetical protein
MIRYETDFAGVVTIRPRLSDAFVASFNEVASRRNNTLGDGDKGSFDDLVPPPPLLPSLSGDQAGLFMTCGVRAHRCSAIEAQEQRSMAGPTTPSGPVRVCVPPKRSP